MYIESSSLKRASSFSYRDPSLEIFRNVKQRASVAPFTPPRGRIDGIGWSVLDGPIMEPGRATRSKEIEMGRKLYVGNLSYNTYEDGLRSLFQSFGQVDSVRIITDRDSGQSKGFGFVEMGTDDQARAAIEGTNGREFEGRQLKVNEAMDKPRRDNDRY